MKKFVLCGLALIMCVVIFFQTQVTISSDAADSSSNDKIVRFMWWTDNQCVEIWKKTFKVYPDSPLAYEAISKKFVKNYESKYVQYGIFTGDFVWEADSDKGVFPWAVGGWPNAEHIFNVIDYKMPLLKLLDRKISYGVLAGNHDIINGDYSPYTKRFGEHRFKNKPCYGGSFKNNVGHYDLISAGGVDFVIVYMSYGVNSTDASNYVDSVLKKYPNKKAIICTHEDPYWVRMVAHDNSNVFMTLHGHYYYEGVHDYTSSHGDGTGVIHHLAHNYQTSGEVYVGQPGYFRMIEMNITQNTLKLWSENAVNGHKIDESEITKLFY